MEPTLVILAAGMGSRYGGLKQLEAVGPSGETIMDYSMYDALRAGFGKAVFVIRPEMEAAFRETIGRRYERHIPVAYAFQRLSDLPGGLAPPPGRTKPWGTGQAVLAARDQIREPFAVVNADDFYGANSFAVLGEFLRGDQEGELPTYAMVGFTLRDTLTEAGAVNRGCCQCDAEGWLEQIVEILDIERDGVDGRYTDESGTQRTIAGDELVSMNMWGFAPEFVGQLQQRFAGFLEEHADSESAEYYLPVAIQELMRAGRARVKVLPTSDRWCGVTHPQDLARVEEMIRARVEAGAYPPKLWGRG